MGSLSICVHPQFPIPACHRENQTSLPVQCPGRLCSLRVHAMPEGGVGESRRARADLGCLATLPPGSQLLTAAAPALRGFEHTGKTEVPSVSWPRTAFPLSKGTIILTSWDCEGDRSMCVKSPVPLTLKTFSSFPLLLPPRLKKSLYVIRAHLRPLPAPKMLWACRTL